MRDKLFLAMGLLFLFLLAGCWKDFSLNAEYEEFPIVWGLIEVTDNTHYVKVYKSFLPEDNAYLAAKDIHLYSYIDSIDVYMEERDANGSLLRKIPFDTTTEIPKDSGLFAYPTQIVYKAHAELNIDYRYQLFIYNPYTKKMAYSQPILLAGQVEILNPRGFGNMPAISIKEGPFLINHKPGKNIYWYEYSILFYYSETMKDNSTKQGKPILWYMGKNDTLTNYDGFIYFQSREDCSFFFKNIAANITDNENVVARHTDSIVLSVNAAGKDWYNYLLVNRPYSGINQERLPYSNISAYVVEKDTVPKYALGLFSTRSVTTRWFRELMMPSSRDSLIYGRYTKELKFTK